MGKLRIAINGFGRIGRVFFRVIYDHPQVEIVAINDLADAHTLGHLLKYDSVHRGFPVPVTWKEDRIFAGSQSPLILKEKDPAALPWKELGVDIVIESTGFFLDKASAMKHITAGAKKVVLSAPPNDNEIKAVLLGVNEQILSDDYIMV